MYLLIYSLIFDCTGSSLLSLVAAGVSLVAPGVSLVAAGVSLVAAGVVHRLLLAAASLVVGHRLQELFCASLAAPRHVESSQTRDQTHVPGIGRWILIYSATREVPQVLLLRFHR